MTDIASPPAGLRLVTGRLSWDNLCFFALVAGLAVTPLWFGSNRQGAWCVNAIFFSLVLLGYEGSLLFRHRLHPVAIHRIGFVLAVFTLVCIWISVQFAVQVLPTHLTHPLWGAAATELSLPVPATISLNVDQSFWALLRLLTVGSVFWLSLQLCRNRARARLLIGSIAISGGVYAIYGIVQLFVFPQTMLWFKKLFFDGSLTSTFVNRNSYATYAGIGLVASLACAYNGINRAAAQNAQSRRRQLAGIVAELAGQSGLWLAVSLMISIALILTGSRGGIGATMFGLFTILLFFAIRGRRNALATGILIMLSLAIIGIGLVNFGEFYTDRLWQQGLESKERFAAYKITMLTIMDLPAAGFGYGTFNVVFPMYRDSSVGIVGYWDRAHNTYLEMLQGLGIPFTLLFLSGTGVLFWRCLYAASVRARSITAPVTALAASIIVSLHSFVDFSMQIQSIALTWVAILGAGVSQSWSSKLRTES